MPKYDLWDNVNEVYVVGKKARASTGADLPALTV